jgi:DNA polymerase-4
MSAAARICCLDLDTFFVSVERILDPSLDGKPVIVGGLPGSRGVVTACSYEVRACGVKSGMSLTEAARLAPGAIFLPGHFHEYTDYAERVRVIAQSYTPESRVASIDELYLDFSGCELVYESAEDADHDATIARVCRKIQTRIRDEVGLPASCGIGAYKTIAKVASGLAKPAGVLLVKAGTEAAFLAPLPVRKLPGIGPVAEEKLHDRGLFTLGEVARAPLAELRKVFGAWAESIHAHVNGRGLAALGRDRPAFREHDPEGETVGSISNERTFSRDLSRRHDIETRLAALTERVCWRARKRGVKARTISLKVRFTDFRTISRAKTIAPTNHEREVYPAVLDLLEVARRFEARRKNLPIRLLGIQLSNLGFYDDQLELFEPDGRLYGALDEIREKFGFDAVKSASALSAGKREDRDDSRFAGVHPHRSG